MSLHKIRVGDEVRFRLAGRSVVGKVREDRGPIGIGGRHLYLIAFEMGTGNPYSIELPREEIERVERKKGPA